MLVLIYAMGQSTKIIVELLGMYRYDVDAENSMVFYSKEAYQLNVIPIYLFTVCHKSDYVGAR